MADNIAFVQTSVIPPSPPPPTERVGPLQWLQKNLFNNVFNSILTILLIWLIWSVVSGAVSWMVVNGIFTSEFDADGDRISDACRTVEAGACWPFLYEKYRLIIFGLYPFDEQWRPLVVVFCMIALLVTSANKAWWSRRELWAAWLVGVPIMGALLSGGFWGMEYVPTTQWGGLALTIGMSTLALFFAFPLSIFLALGRRSNLPAIKLLCVCFIELVRGVPLITVLFMSSLLIPLFLPEGTSFDKLLRAQIGITLFLAAYLAEVVRGGLQAVPKGQYEAADSLGLTYWQKMRLIILPQALSISIPPLVNTFIGLFKDTSLVIIIGIFDLLGAARASLTDPEWLGFYKEAYLFICVIYFFFCYSMSKYSQYLEKELNKGTRR